MPRPRRVHIEGALYYVTSRASEEAPLFQDAQDYEMYLELLEGYRAQYRFKLFGCVLLAKELHLCLELTNGTTISTIMHAINSRYTKYVNKRYHHSGHVFQQRFKSTLCEKAPYLLRITRYLHVLPLRLGLVSQLKEYSWSNYHTFTGIGDATIGATEQPEVREVLEALGKKQQGFAYEQYVRAGTEGEWEALDQELQKWFVGSSAFLAKVEGSTMPYVAEPIRPMPQPLPRPRRQVSLALAASLAIALLGVSVTGLLTKGLDTFQEAVQVFAEEQTQPHDETKSDEDQAPKERTALVAVPSRLNGTVWEVEVRGNAAQGATVQLDEILFQDGKVITQQMATQGFSPSNYSLRHQSDGVLVWETMLSNAEGVVICWRGERQGNLMRGVMTRQSPGQPLISYEFIGAGANTAPEAAPNTMTEI